MKNRNLSVFLRAFEEDDYLLINTWRNDYEIQSLTCGHFRYVSKEMEKEWAHNLMLHNQKDVYLAICVNDESKKMIGYTSINNIDYTNRTAHGGGIVIGDKNARDGCYLIDATRLVFDHVFSDMGLHRFTGSCLKEHKTSRVMMQMMGGELEAIRKDAVFKAGRYHTVLDFVTFADDYFRLEESGAYSEREVAKRVMKIRKAMNCSLCVQDGERESK